jgi:FKBP-type peptidyl-prolyl cis-trans isomerase
MIPVRLSAALALGFAVATAVLLPVTPCRADDTTKPPEKPANTIPADTEIVTTASGLKYSVLVAGKEGQHPKLGDRVKVHYTGWLVDGTKFDSSRDRGAPTEFTLGQVIPGWNEGLALMTVGARWKLTIPPALGYGARGMPPTIPANATLIFDVELIDVHFAPVMPTFHAAVPEAQKTTASGLKYETLKQGAGDSPSETDVAELKFALFSTKGDLVDCSEKLEKTLKARAVDLTIPFMKEAISLLKPGARLRFEVPPEQCFGDKPIGPLPAKSTTVWELELVSVIKPLPVPPFAMPDEAKLKTTASGLKYEVIAEGDAAGVSPKMGQVVKVHYAGWLADGTLFDSSYPRAEEMTLRLGRVIPGWNEGLALMKPGATYKFVIPPALGYGERGMPPKIPANATLVFLVTLVKVGE